MLAEERRAQICARIGKNGSAELGELSQALGVSAETIRRDLIALERAGRLQRTHGGAIPAAGMAREGPLSERKEAYPERKRELAAFAMRLIHEGDVIALDSGSTAAEFAGLIAQNFRDLTVVTHSLDVFLRLSPAESIRVILCGGQYLARERAFWGQLTLDALSELHVGKAFVFPIAVSLKCGAAESIYELYQVQRQYFRIADEVVIAADSSKFEKTAPLLLCGTEPGRTFITDSALSDELYALYRQNNINLLRSEKE